MLLFALVGVLLLLFLVHNQPCRLVLGHAWSAQRARGPDLSHAHPQACNIYHKAHQGRIATSAAYWTTKEKWTENHLVWSWDVTTRPITQQHMLYLCYFSVNVLLSLSFVFWFGHLLSRNSLLLYLIPKRFFLAQRSAADVVDSLLCSVACPM